MSHTPQIFQTRSRLRWTTIKWISRLFIFLILAMIPVFWLALGKVNNTILPGLTVYDTSRSVKLQPAKGFTLRDRKKYHGFEDYVNNMRRNQARLKSEKQQVHSEKIRSAFYVDWDPQALYSLKNHISELNTVMPEWFFLDPQQDTLVTHIDREAYELMKKHPVHILPMLSNVNYKKQDGEFDPLILKKLLADPRKKEKLISALLLTLQSYQLQGVNIDFEEIPDGMEQPLIAFQRELYSRMHAAGYTVTQDVMADNDSYRMKDLSACNDYIFLMAYDEHYTVSEPGPVADQKWVEKQMDQVAREIPAEKIVLAIPSYGYDWPESDTAATITYPEAISKAREYNAVIDFDNDTYNCSYTYKDEDSVLHHVYFMDAGGNFNSLRFADQYGAAGVALWRLGAEDERIWKFYSRDLSNESLQKLPFDFSELGGLDITTEDPDYVSEGEILDVLSAPEKGIIKIESDEKDKLVSEQLYQQLPTRYVIRRFGKVNNQVILTFDDGPDPLYTPRILDILEKEKVPAGFFVVGINGEANLPLLKRIYRDGFEIGNHSFTHPNMATVSSSRAETEMEATRLLIESATGHSTILFRAPYNADAEPTKAVELKPVASAQQSHYYTVGESIDPEDWDTEHGINADTIFNRVVRGYEDYQGSKGIILLHDAGGNREATVEALPRIIAYFKQKGVQFTTVGQLLHLPKEQVMPPVQSELLKMNKWVFLSVYWVSNLFSFLFRLAIVLGLIRILIMGILAALQYIRNKKVKRMNDPVHRKVSLIVPAYNESVNAVNTVRNLLQQDYPDLEIIFVDDGSKDATFSMVRDAFAGHPQVKVFTKPNGGKASALNFGIALAAGEYVVCIDADTQLKSDAVRLLMQYFGEEKVVAVAGNVKVGNEKNVLTRWQSIEYTTAQNFDRLAFDYLNCITVVPGAIGAFCKQAILDAGGFTTDTLAEDCDLTMRLLRNRGVVRNCTEALAVTEAPETLQQFMRQRFRWTYGIMQSFWKNKDALFRSRYGALGWVALPNILLFQIILPLIAPVADILFFFSLIWNRHDPASLHQILFYYGIFLVVDMGVSFMAFYFEKEKPLKLLWLIPQRFVYRQLMYVILFRSVRKAVKGEVQGWGALKRTGNVVLNQGS